MGGHGDFPVSLRTMPLLMHLSALCFINEDQLACGRQTEDEMEGEEGSCKGGVLVNGIRMRGHKYLLIVFSRPLDYVPEAYGRCCFLPSCRAVLLICSALCGNRVSIFIGAGLI